MLCLIPSDNTTSAAVKEKIEADVRAGVANTWAIAPGGGITHTGAQLKGKNRFVLSVDDNDGSLDIKCVDFEPGSSDPLYVFSAYHSELLQLLITHFQGLYKRVVYHPTTLTPPPKPKQ